MDIKELEERFHELNAEARDALRGRRTQEDWDTVLVKEEEFNRDLALAGIDLKVVWERRTICYIFMER
jgi:hypothetical protein